MTMKLKNVGWSKEARFERFLCNNRNYDLPPRAWIGEPTHRAFKYLFRRWNSYIRDDLDSAFWEFINHALWTFWTGSRKFNGNHACPAMSPVRKVK